MIRKNSLFIKLFKLKISSKSFFEKYMAFFCVKAETCPTCKSSGNLNIHSYYKRNLIDFIDGQVIHHTISITRTICESCGSTHAILPDFIIPYCSYSLFFILRVLSEYFLHILSVEALCEKFHITSKQLYKWVKLFHTHEELYTSFINFMDKASGAFIFYLKHLDSYSAFASSFVKTFAFSFMQSHNNPPTAHYTQFVFDPDYQISDTT